MRNLKNIQVGTKVRISDAVIGSFMANPAMNTWIGKVMTVRSIEDGGNYLRMEEDIGEHGGIGWAWYPSFIESIVFRC